MRALFVCSGNTCRSPLAEAIASTLFGSDGGSSFESAGIDADEGAPASPGAVTVALEIGLDLSGHRARRVTRDMIERADEVYAMTSQQREALVAIVPDAGARVFELDPSGAGIPDPFGGDLDRYRRARDRIGAAVEARLGSR